MADEELVKKFVELHAQTEQLLSSEKIKEAKQKYLEVVDTYHAIEKSSLEHFHKELAYDQVTNLFKKVNETKERVEVPWHLVAAGALMIAFSIIIFLKPSIVGLTGFEDLARQPVDFTFLETKLQDVTLRDRPLSLLASGEFTGRVKLFYKQGDKFELIFDSQKSHSENGKFTDVCEETCDIIAASNSIQLFAQIEKGSTLHVKELAYKIQHKGNSAPVWKGATRTFTASPGKQTSINLNNYFTDPDNDPLVYLSTTDQGLDVVVQNDQVIITPQKGATGTKNINFVASDLLEVTRIAVTVEIK